MAHNLALSEVGAMLAHPALWRKMVKLKDSTGNPLQVPAELTAIPKLWTTAAPLVGGTTAKAVIGRWSDLLFGVRKSITVRMLQEAFMGTKLQVAMLCYARVGFAPTRAQSFARWKASLWRDAEGTVRVFGFTPRKDRPFPFALSVAPKTRVARAREGGSLILSDRTYQDRHGPSRRNV